MAIAVAAQVVLLVIAIARQREERQPLCKPNPPPKDSFGFMHMGGVACSVGIIQWMECFLLNCGRR